MTFHIVQHMWLVFAFERQNSPISSLSLDSFQQPEFFFNEKLLSRNEAGQFIRNKTVFSKI